MNGAMFYNLAESFYRLGLYDDAVENFLKVFDYESQILASHGKKYTDQLKAGASYFLYLIFRKRKEHKRAKEYRKKAFEIQPDWGKIPESKLLEHIE